MKKWTWLLLLGTIIVVPIILLAKKTKQDEENIRYDINDYVTEEGL